MNWSAAGAFLLALAVALGAFGAHGLRGRLDPYSLGIYEKAVFYHFVHALGLLIAGAMARSGSLSPLAARRSGLLLLAGIVLFSGSLYLLAVTGWRLLGMVTPLGGLAFIAAWLVLGMELTKAFPIRKTPSKY
jgi:uncharacterized membrane protein YgdD (TMEM256/DUF423 family)